MCESVCVCLRVCVCACMCMCVCVKERERERESERERERACVRVCVSVGSRAGNYSRIIGSCLKEIRIYKNSYECSKNADKNR